MKVAISKQEAKECSYRLPASQGTHQGGEAVAAAFGNLHGLCGRLHHRTMVN